MNIDKNNFDLLNTRSPEFHNLDQDVEMEIVPAILGSGNYCCAYTAIFDHDSARDLYVKSSQESWGTFATCRNSRMWMRTAIWNSSTTMKKYDVTANFLFG